MTNPIADTEIKTAMQASASIYKDYYVYAYMSESVGIGLYNKYTYYITYADDFTNSPLMLR